MSAIGEMIDEMHEIREQRRELAKEDGVLKRRYYELENNLIQTLEAAGLDKGSSSLATASVKITPVSNVTDWNTFFNYIKENDAFYLLERRVLQTAYREFLETHNKPPPGVETFQKTSLSLRVRG